jgi:hypothetical protein
MFGNILSKLAAKRQKPMSQPRPMSTGIQGMMAKLVAKKKKPKAGPAANDSATPNMNMM